MGINLALGFPPGAGPGAGGAEAVVYLLRDEFTTAEAAPIASPRTCEPGPGILEFTDTGNKGSIDFQRLDFAQNSTANALSWRTVFAHPRACGLAITSHYLEGQRANGANPLAWIGTSTPVKANANIQLGFYNNGGNRQMQVGAATFHLAKMYDNGARLWIIARTAGAFAITDHKLWWVDNVSNVPNLYGAGWEEGGVSSQYEDVRVLQLGAPWTTDYGIATAREAAPDANTTLIHEADAILEATWTPGADETLDLEFRRTDDANCLLLRCNQAAGTIKLYRRQGGVETELTGGTTTQTWSAGTAYRIIIRADGSALSAFVANVAKNVTNSTFNITATEARNTLAVSDFVVWPIYLTGAPLTELQRVGKHYPLARQGVVIGASAYEPTVIYEGSPQILTEETNVFKMWYSKGTGTGAGNGTCYAESADGITWTQHASNPLIVGVYRNSVLHVGATYYMYVAPYNDPQIDLYTSSDGVNWTLDTASVIARGAVGQSDNLKVANTHVWQEAPDDWRMLYDATGGVYPWCLHYATSPDGRTWTKYAENPVLTNGMIGGPCVHKSGDTYYLWCHAGVDGTLPTEGYRYISTDLITWTPFPRGAINWRDTADEGALLSGQVADQYILAVGGVAYLYYTATPDGGAGTSRIKLQTGPEAVITGDWA